MPFLPASLAAANREELLPILQQELQAKDLPLELFLTHGGWPEAPQIKLRGVRETPEHVNLLLTVQFIEQCPAACPASARPETRIAYMIASIRKQDAFAQILPDDT
jgi:hypothetical protein